MLKGFSLTAIITILSSAFPFLLLPILTRTLPKEQYGTLVVIELFLAIFTTLIHFSISGSTVEYFKMSREKLKEYLSTSIYLAAFSLLLLQIVVFLFDDFFYVKFQMNKAWLLAIPIMSFMNIATQLQNSLHICQKNHSSYAVFLLGPNALIFGLTVLFLYVFKMEFQAKLFAILISYTVFGIVSFYLLFKGSFISFEFYKDYLRPNLDFTVPILVHSLVASLYFSADRLFLSKMIGNNAVAVYAAGFQIASIMSVLQNAFSRAWHPMVMDLLSEKSIAAHGAKIVRNRLFKYSFLSSILMILISAVLLIVVYFMVDLILPSSYEESKIVSALIIISYCVLGFYKIVSPVLWFYNRTAILSKVTVLVFFINLVLNYFLILHFRVVGACYATLLSVLAQFILTGFVFMKLVSDNLGKLHYESGYEEV